MLFGQRKDITEYITLPVRGHILYIGKLAVTICLAQVVLSEHRTKLTIGILHGSVERRLLNNPRDSLDRFGSVWFGSVRIGSVQLASVRFGEVRFGSNRFGLFRFVSDRFGPVSFGSVRIGSVQFGSARLGLVRIGSIQIGSC